jgi:hypothetical protein
MVDALITMTSNNAPRVMGLIRSLSRTLASTQNGNGVVAVIFGSSVRKVRSLLSCATSRQVDQRISLSESDESSAPIRKSQNSSSLVLLRRRINKVKHTVLILRSADWRWRPQITVPGAQSVGSERGITRSTELVIWGMD